MNVLVVLLSKPDSNRKDTYLLHHRDENERDKYKQRIAMSIERANNVGTPKLRIRESPLHLHRYLSPRGGRLLQALKNYRSIDIPTFPTAADKEEGKGGGKELYSTVRNQQSI